MCFLRFPSQKTLEMTEKCNFMFFLPFLDIWKYVEKHKIAFSDHWWRFFRLWNRGCRIFAYFVPLLGHLLGHIRLLGHTHFLKLAKKCFSKIRKLTGPVLLKTYILNSNFLFFPTKFDTNTKSPTLQIVCPPTKPIFWTRIFLLFPIKFDKNSKSPNITNRISPVKITSSMPDCAYPTTCESARKTWLEARGDRQSRAYESERRRCCARAWSAVITRWMPA